MGVRTISDIREDLDRATARRTEIWEGLGEGTDPEKAAEAAALSERIDALWSELRIAEARARFGPAEDIIARARAEDRLDREARRVKRAA